MDEEEKQALELFRKMQPKTRYMVMAQLMFAVEVEENARKLIREGRDQGDGIMGLDAPLFNGAGLVPGPAA
jgi:hypothetical protein